MATRLLVNTLASHGHSVDILTYPLGSEPPHTAARIFRSAGLPGITKIAIGASWQKLALDIPLTIKLARLAQPGVYDVVHAVEEAVFPALALARHHGAKVVYDMDSSLAAQLLESQPRLSKLRAPIHRLEKWALSRADLVVAVCEELAELARVARASGDRVHVLSDVPLEADPSGAVVEDLTALWSGNKTLALYVGNLAEYQGIDLLIDSVSRIPVSNAIGTIIIGGSDQDIASYQSKIEGLGLAESILLLGRRPAGDLPAYLEQADILLSPRIKGGNTPLKIYSYMAAGKAILATRLSSHTQVLDDTCACLVDRDSEAMAHALSQLAKNRQARERIGQEAKRRVAQEYSMAHYDASLRAAYQSFASD